MIIITSGVYGGKDGIKTAADGPFSLPPAEEARLVARKVARYTNKIVVDPAPIYPGPAPDADADADELADYIDPIGFNETPPDELETVVEVDLTTLSAKELRELGAEYGLTFKGNASRVSMIDQIMAAQEEMEAEDTGESPDFDPAEAVV